MHENPLAEPYRPIRRVAPPDVPLAGVLVTAGADTVLLVPIEAVADPIWRLGAADHLWHVQDVVRRKDGHDAVLAWCAQPVHRWLRAGEVGAGEAVTIAVSMMRGLEAMGSGTMPSGAWWLTDTGMPVFVAVDGAPMASATAEVATALADACHDVAVVRLLHMLADACAQPDVGGRLAEIEAQLFLTAAPVPVRDRLEEATTLEPYRAAMATHLYSGTRTEQPAVGAGVALARRAAAAVAAAVSRWAPQRSPAAHEAPRMPPARGALQGTAHAGDGAPRGTRGRRRPLLLAAAIVCAIVTAGVLWPNESPVPGQAVTATAAAGDGATGATAVADEGEDVGGAAGESDEPATVPPAADVDPIEAAVSLIALAAACTGGEVDCAGLALSAESTGLLAVARDPTMQADYGGITVVAARSGEEAIAIVLEQRDGFWQVRDVLREAGHGEEEQKEASGG